MSIIAFIIPTLNEASTIAAVLQPLQSARMAGHVVVVADGGSDDDTVALAEPYADQVINCAAGRALQMNKGAQAEAAGSVDVLLFLHADTQLPEQGVELVCQAFSDPTVRWGWFDACLGSSDWRLGVIARAMSLRARLTRVCTGDQALFVTRQQFEAVGGFPELPLMEDVAISKALRRSARSVVIRQPVITSGRRWESHGVMRTVWLMWKLRLLYFMGASPDHLARIYYPSYPAQAHASRHGPSETQD